MWRLRRLRSLALQGTAGGTHLTHPKSRRYSAGDLSMILRSVIIFFVRREQSTRRRTTHIHSIEHHFFPAFFRRNMVMNTMDTVVHVPRSNSRMFFLHLSIGTSWVPVTIPIRMVNKTAAVSSPHIWRRDLNLTLITLLVSHADADASEKILRPEVTAIPVIMPNGRYVGMVRLVLQIQWFQSVNMSPDMCKQGELPEGNPHPTVNATVTMYSVAKAFHAVMTASRMCTQDARLMVTQGQHVNSVPEPALLFGS